jgi:predicted transcriptional regulator of viral defense system
MSAYKIYLHKYLAVYIHRITAIMSVCACKIDKMRCVLFVMNIITFRANYKDKKIISPVNGLYVIVPAEYKSYGSIPAEELVPIIMRYLEADCYVGLLSAGLFFGATHQKPARFQVITNKRIKHSLEFGSVVIELAILLRRKCG